MSKQCGYCRLVGHDVRHCETKKNQILAIRHHVGRERQTMHDMIVANGYGVGAMIELSTYRGVEPSVVTSLTDTFNGGGIYQNNELDWRMHRYRKSVRCTLISRTGKPEPFMGLSDDYIQYRFANMFFIVARPLSDLSDTLYAAIELSSLSNKVSGFTPTVERGGYYGYNFAKLLAPSFESDVTRDDLGGSFPVHHRLSSDKNNYPRLTPIFP